MILPLSASSRSWKPSTRAVRRFAPAAAAIALAGALAPPAAAQHFDDPFAYCAAVGTTDAPDARYAGPKTPEAIARGLARALDLPAAAPIEGNWTWRCVAGRVYACAFGANLPCEEKAYLSRSPTAAMRAFCRDNPGADDIPMVVTGRATVYAWRCESGAPIIERRIAEPDARGYLAGIWYPIAHPED